MGEKVNLVIFWAWGQKLLITGQQNSKVRSLQERLCQPQGVRLQHFLLDGETQQNTSFSV